MGVVGRIREADVAGRQNDVKRKGTTTIKFKINLISGRTNMAI